MEDSIEQFIGNSQSESAAAKSLGISIMTLRNYRQQGRISAVTGCGLVRYSAAAIGTFRKQWLPIIKKNGNTIGWGRTRFAKTVGIGKPSLRRPECKIKVIANAIPEVKN